MKISNGANNEVLLLPVDPEADQNGHEESSVMRSPELSGNVQSTRYMKFLTIVVVVAALFGSTMYLSSSTRENISRRLSKHEESNSDAVKTVKTVNIGPHTTIKDIIDQLLFGPSPPKDQSNDHIGTKTINSTMILFDQIYDHLFHNLFLHNKYSPFLCSASRILQY
jgi:hypothetical protein